MSEDPAATLHSLAGRQSELTSQIAALRKRVEFVRPEDRAHLAAALACANAATRSLAFLELQAAGGVK